MGDGDMGVTSTGMATEAVGNTRLSREGAQSQGARDSRGKLGQGEGQAWGSGRGHCMELGEEEGSAGLLAGSAPRA